MKEKQREKNKDRVGEKGRRVGHEEERIYVERELGNTVGKHGFSSICEIEHVVIPIYICSSDKLFYSKYSLPT
jgi:hypothetical protein